MTVLPDVLANNLDIVFCGTAVGNASARRRAYYAGPGNAFWPTLFEVGLTPRLLRPEQYREVIAFGLGFTDLAKSVSGVDAQLSARHFDPTCLREVIMKYKPRIVAFTSKRAAREFLGVPAEYGALSNRVGDTLLFVLPSPSGAARGFWNESFWRELSHLRKDISRKASPNQRLKGTYRKRATPARSAP